MKKTKYIIIAVVLLLSINGFSQNKINFNKGIDQIWDTVFIHANNFEPQKLNKDFTANLNKTKQVKLTFKAVNGYKYDTIIQFGFLRKQHTLSLYNLGAIKDTEQNGIIQSFIENETSDSCLFVCLTSHFNDYSSPINEYFELIKHKNSIYCLYDFSKTGNISGIFLPKIEIKLATPEFLDKLIRFEKEVEKNDIEFCCCFASEQCGYITILLGNQKKLMRNKLTDYNGILEIREDFIQLKKTK